MTSIKVEFPKKAQKPWLIKAFQEPSGARGVEMSREGPSLWLIAVGSQCGLSERERKCAKITSKYLVHYVLLSGCVVY